jgi:hypothetical protein
MFFCMLLSQWPPGSSCGPSSAVKRVTSSRGFTPLCVTPYATGLHVLGCNTERQHFVRGRFSPCLPVSARAVVKSTVDGRFPAGELICRAPGLFATSAFLGGGEAHSHIEPPEVRPINLYSLPKRTEWTAEHTKEEHVNENGVQTKAAEVLGLRTRVQRVGDLQRALRRERIGAGEDRLRPRPGRLPQLRITQCCSAGRAPYKLALVSIVSNARAREGYGRGQRAGADAHTGRGRKQGATYICKSTIFETYVSCMVCVSLACYKSPLASPKARKKSVSASIIESKSSSRHASSTVSASASDTEDLAA